MGVELHPNCNRSKITGNSLQLIAITACNVKIFKRREVLFNFARKDADTPYANRRSVEGFNGRLKSSLAHDGSGDLSLPGRR
jgi:hypothetical protein